MFMTASCTGQAYNTSHKNNCRQNEVELSYHRVRGLYSVAVIFAATILVKFLFLTPTHRGGLLIFPICVKNELHFSYNFYELLDRKKWKKLEDI